MKAIFSSLLAISIGVIFSCQKRIHDPCEYKKVEFFFQEYFEARKIKSLTIHTEFNGIDSMFLGYLLFDRKGKLIKQEYPYSFYYHTYDKKGMDSIVRFKDNFLLASKYINGNSSDSIVIKEYYDEANTQDVNKLLFRKKIDINYYCNDTSYFFISPCSEKVVIFDELNRPKVIRENIKCEKNYSLDRPYFRAKHKYIWPGYLELNVKTIESYFYYDSVNIKKIIEIVDGRKIAEVHFSDGIVEQVVNHASPTETDSIIVEKYDVEYWSDD